MLTNGHVLGIADINAIPLGPGQPPFSLTNRLYPDAWYNVPAVSQVSIGSGATGFNGVASDGRSMTSRTQFIVDDRNGDVLRSGDVIGLKTTNNRYLFVDGGRIGGRVLVDALYNRFDGWQQLRVAKVDGSAGLDIRSFDRVNLRVNRDGSYIAPRNGRIDPTLTADAMERVERHHFIILRVGGPRPIRSNDRVLLVSSVSGWVQAPFIANVTQFALPGFDDLALLRLDSPVPADAATPARLRTSLPAGMTTPAQFYANKTFEALGFGENATGTPQRQKGTFNNATLRERPTVFQATGVNGAQIRCGDSGGGWYWTGDSPAWRQLVGITQGGGCGAINFAGGTFLSPLSTGGSDPAGRSKPDLTAWFGLHLRIDDCRRPPSFSGGSWNYRGLRSDLACYVGGGQDNPIAVVLSGPVQPGETCMATIDPRMLRLVRGPSRWTLAQGSALLWSVPDTWQQSYTRGTYLIDLLQRRGATRMCYQGARSNPSLIYFR